MTFDLSPPSQEGNDLPKVANWATRQFGESIEDIAFSTGAVLNVLHLLLQDNRVPAALWRARLALRAAEASVAVLGRPERAPELRDEVHLLRPGDQPGPAGMIYQQWQGLVAHPIRIARLHRILPEKMQGRVAGWMAMGHGSPVAQATTVLQFVLSEFPRHEVEALMLGDAVLARACGWDHTLPLLAAGLKPRDLRRTEDDLRLACHRAVFNTGRQAAQMALDLNRRAARLRLVAPKLRAKAADDAVDLFLSRDAVSPSVALRNVMSDRAARRLCDRLVDLGAVQELTGRTTFRLYGVGA